MKIKVIPFNETIYSDNYIVDIYQIIGRIVKSNNYGYCFCKSINKDGLELLNNQGVFTDSIENILCVYRIFPKFIYEDEVQSTNGTSVTGTVVDLFYHGNDAEFKYFIRDKNGKKLKRRYNSDDLRKIQISNAGAFVLATT